MCGGEIFAVRYRLADAAERVGGATLDDAKDFLWRGVRRARGKRGWTHVATGAVGHDGGEYAAVESMGYGVHAEELGEGHGGFEESSGV